jgi:hypothetical protein
MTALSPDTLAQMRALWEGSPELSAAAIGARLGVTKNTVIGQAHRRKWKSRSGAHKPAIYSRLDAHHAAFDRVLAETRPWVEDRKPVLVAG